MCAVCNSAGTQVAVNATGQAVTTKTPPSPPAAPKSNITGTTPVSLLLQPGNRSTAAFAEQACEPSASTWGCKKQVRQSREEPGLAPPCVTIYSQVLRWSVGSAVLL